MASSTSDVKLDTSGEDVKQHLDSIPSLKLNDGNEMPMVSVLPECVCKSWGHVADRIPPICCYSLHTVSGRREPMTSPRT